MPQPPRAWQRMLSGRRLNLLEPSWSDIEIEDIAHGLSRVARWNGQTLGEHPYSVAEHSLLVEAICRDLKPSLTAAQSLVALLHDAPEYVIGDLISPFKAMIGGAYKDLEARLLDECLRRYGLSADAATMALIKKADRTAAYREAVGLAGFDEEEATAIFKPPRGVDTAPLPPTDMAAPEVKAGFLARFNALLAAL